MTNSSLQRRISVLGGAAVLAAGVVTAGAGAAQAVPTAQCMTAGTSGFTAAVVASRGQQISNRVIDATGCDVGIYVADGASHVTISRVTVTGANDAGILVQNTSHVTITRSIVHDNGLHSTPGPKVPGTPPVQGELDQAFGISLFGVSDSTLSRNTVYDNGRGGIGVMDDGPIDPGQVVGGPGTSPSTPVPSNNVVVSRNTLWGNLNGCAIVVAPFNVGDHMGRVVVTRNVVIGTGGADVGGIVAQTNGPASVLSDVTISRNTVIGSGEGGVIVHAAAPGSYTSNVHVTRNTLIHNNVLGGETGNTTGVVVSSRLPGGPVAGQQNLDTVVSRNVILGQYYGVWTSGPNAPTLSRNTIVVTASGVPFYTAPTS